VVGNVDRFVGIQRRAAKVARDFQHSRLSIVSRENYKAEKLTTIPSKRITEMEKPWTTDMKMVVSRCPQVA
jgi:hypothetical protein